MVDLPTVGNGIVTSTAPESAVSRRDIQQSADLMAGAINKVADATEGVAEKLASRAAADDLQQQKVVRNADGSVTTVNPASSVIFGRAGEIYEQAIKAGTIAQHANIVSTELNDIHLKHQADPLAFKAASDSWKESYLKTHGGGEVGEALSRQFDQLQSQHFNAISDTAAKVDLSKQGSAITALQSGARNDVLAMVRGGTSLEDPALQSKIQQFEAVTRQRAANPLFGYSKEQAQLDIDTFHGEATANKLIYNVNQIYQNKGEGGGYDGAMKAAKDILVNPSYKLSESERDGYYHKVVADIRANEASRRQDITEAQGAFNELLAASAAKVQIDSSWVENVAKAFRDAGAPDRAARVYAAFMRKPLTDSFSQQPLSEQTNQLTALQGMNAAATAHRFFVSKGYTPEQSAGIVGNLVHESGVDPTAVGDGGTSAGLAQFHNERLTALREFAKQRGTAPTDFQTQLDFIDKELRGGKSGIIASNLPAADAALKLTPQEKNLYQRHLTNLTGPGGVDNPDGSRSTLYQASVEHDGKTYNIPTVWDGKILPIGEALKRVEQEGWDKFPAYKNQAQAEARYQQMHAFMDKDTGQYFQPGTEDATYKKLAASKTPEEAAAAFISYERPKGWTPDNPAAGLGYQSRQALARQVFDGKPDVLDKSMGPAGSLWLQVNRQKTVATATEAAWTTIMADFNKSGVRPSPQRVTDMIAAARASRDPDLLDTIAHDSQRMDIAGTSAQAPLAGQQALITDLTAMGQRGDLSPGNAALLADLNRNREAVVKGLQENPIATTVAKFPDKFRPVGPLDFSSEGSLAGDLAARAAISQFARNNWQTGPLSVLDRADVQQFQAALSTPQGGQVLRAMGSALRPEELQAVLDTKEMRDAVVGMQSNPDPAKMSAANQVADKLWRANPALAESLLGKSAIDKLHAWQGMKDTFSPEEIAQNLNAPRDAGVMRVREEMRKAALTESEKLKPSDVAYKLGSGSWLFGGDGPLSATPQLAASGQKADFRYLPDSIAGGVLLDDYRQSYAALRADGVDQSKAADLALKRLQSTWGLTQIGGDKVMKRPPEQYYPSIYGSHDWIDEDLRTYVAKQAGPEFKDNMRSLEAGPAFAGKERRWDIAGLLSDSQTETEINARQPPSYIVAIKRDDGTLALLDRVKFDPTNPISAYSQKLNAMQQRVAQARAAGLSLGSALP